MIDRKLFFNHIRTPLFGGRLSRRQADGLDTLLDIWEAEHAGKDRRWLAYALATAYHEVAFTMQPIRERGGRRYFHAMYDRDGRRPRVAARLGNTQKGDGVRFHGRGYVQLTGRANYAKAGALVGEDLVARPDLALRADIAGRILFSGMEAGLFTGRRLADYFDGPKEDWRNARRIVNGLDRAQQIAGYARQFHAGIGSASG